MTIDSTLFYTRCGDGGINKKDGSFQVKKEVIALSKELLRNKPIHTKQDKESEETLEEIIPYITVLLCYISYAVCMFLAILRELFLKPKRQPLENNREGYVPLFCYKESFYKQNLYRRVQDCFGIPICSVPGATVNINNKTSEDYGWTIRTDEKIQTCLNLASYNYLGFAENKGPCVDSAEISVQKYGLGVCSTRRELGTTDYHQELESLVATFLDVEDSIVCGMGFATNALNIPALVSKGCLVLSDERNHCSIILGIKLSGADIRVFKHNDMADLESQLRESVLKGQPYTHRPWKKIMIFCEGVYSMEGTIVKLPEIIALKKKYKAYLYLDEAHSIGAMGQTGRGVLEYYGCDPKDVDILMGTFTKSFGSAGGYIAGRKELINHMRINSYSEYYAVSMCPPVAYQVIASMRILMGRDGTMDGVRRLRQLARNIRYFRLKLKQLGFTIYGHDDSPVVPVMVYYSAKIAILSRMMRAKNIAMVVVGFPVTSHESTRARICISASHTHEMLDAALKQISEVGDILWLKNPRKRTRRIEY